MTPHLLFDLDGTLTDPRDGITRCLQHALGRLDRPAWSASALERFIGPPLHEAFAEILETNDPATVDRAVGFYRERYEAVGMFENRVHAGVVDGLEALTAMRCPMWVVTSKPEVYAQRIVDHFGLGRFFRRVHGPDLDGSRADKGELIEHVLRIEGLPATGTWMIGDRLHDIVGAAANRVPGIGVLWGYGSRDELAEAGADPIVGSMPELVAHIGRVGEQGA